MKVAIVGSRRYENKKKIKDFIFKLKNEYGENVSLGEEARLDMRQWMTRKNMGHLVTHLQSDGKVISRMGNEANPRSLSGNRKHQEEPEKRIDVAFKEQGGGAEPAYLVLDHITIKTDKGNRDIDLSRYRNLHLLKKNNYKKGPNEGNVASFDSDLGV